MCILHRTYPAKMFTVQYSIVISRPFRRWVVAWAGQGSASTAMRFGFQQGLDVRILIDDERIVLKKAASICRGTVCAVQRMSEDAQIRRQLSPMVRRMRKAPNENPGSTPYDVKERRALFKPGRRPRLEFLQSLFRAQRIFLHKLQTSLNCG